MEQEGVVVFCDKGAVMVFFIRVTYKCLCKVVWTLFFYVLWYCVNILGLFLVGDVFEILGVKG